MASRKLAVTAAAGAAAEYIIGQGLVDAFGDSESQFIGESWQEERKIASAVGKIALAIK